MFKVGDIVTYPNGKGTFRFAEVIGIGKHNTITVKSIPSGIYLNLSPKSLTINHSYQREKKLKKLLKI